MGINYLDTCVGFHRSMDSTIEETYALFTFFIWVRLVYRGDPPLTVLDSPLSETLPSSTTKNYQLAASHIIYLSSVLFSHFKKVPPLPSNQLDTVAYYG